MLFKVITVVACEGQRSVSLSDSSIYSTVSPLRVGNLPQSGHLARSPHLLSEVDALVMFMLLLPLCLG